MKNKESTRNSSIRKGNKAVPKVSVIIPVYNTEKFVKYCLDSIFAQTYPNIELICIDDGSTDGSLAILKSYQKSHKNMKVFHQENKGISATRNFGVKQATGEFIAHADSDDRLRPDYIEKLVTAIGDNDVVFSGHQKLEGDKLIYQARPIVDSVWAPYKFNQSCSKLYRRQFLIDNNISFPVEYQPDEDIFVTMLVLAHTNKVKVIDYIGYTVYVNPTSVTHTTNTSKKNRNTKTLQCLKDIDAKTSFSNNIPVDCRLFLYLKTVVIHLLLQRHILTFSEYYQEYKVYFSWLKEIYAKYGKKFKIHNQPGETVQVNLICNLFIFATKTHTARILLFLLNKLHIAEIA